MSGYVEMRESGLQDDYKFVKNYTLEQLKQLLSTSKANYIAGTTLVEIPDAPLKVPLNLLCDQVVDLTKNRRGWTAEQKAAAADVSQKVENFYQKGYWDYVAGLPCCISWICNFDFSFLCCDCPHGSILETMNLRSRLERESRQS